MGKYMDIGWIDYKTRRPHPRWDRITAQRIITSSDVQAVLDKNPELWVSGFDPTPSHGYREPMDAEYLAALLPPTVAILRTIPLVKTPTYSEEQIRHRLRPTIGYLTSGEFIVAAFLAGMPILSMDYGSPWYGVNRLWMKRLSTRS
jgi:hypothetical protein